MAGGENLGILKGKNKNGALAFLDFYLDDQVMEQICGPQFGLAPKKELARKQAEKDAKYKVFEEELENSISIDNYAQWSSASEKLSEVMVDIILEKRKAGESKTPLQATGSLTLAAVAKWTRQRVRLARCSRK